MKEGQRIAFVRDNSSPLKSPNTRLIAAAVNSGITFASNKPMLDTVEEIAPGDVRRTVTWSMDDSSVAHFRPNFAEEKLGFMEFRRRFESLDWCMANPDHPIAYMRGYSDTLNRLRDRIKTMQPLALIRRGDRVALIPADCDAARRAEILSML